MDPNVTPLDNSNDVIIGTTLFKALGMNPHLAQDPVISAKMREISTYFENHPDPIFAIKSIERSRKTTTQSALDHFSSYVGLQNERAQLKDKIKEVDKQLDFYV